MAIENDSTNTSIVTIIVLVAAAIALGYFFGFFGTHTDKTVETIDRTTVIERPSTPPTTNP